ncbi:hypothetical protein HC248_02467 [Polaromonas vacuolata]|uniref:Uncharacterized protein n=1 Tax=Polaromonas vacuolata TaxID=37448 RepID=A0A6H2HB92_9BURK|nr:hypothetical protein [Polaromonas vacuolata]QJC57151.1 hypothetical protein HC248_02467 [Polaromonas vacuolata]
MQRDNFLLALSYSQKLLDDCIYDVSLSFETLVEIGIKEISKKLNLDKEIFSDVENVDDISDAAFTAICKASAFVFTAEKIGYPDGYELLILANFEMGFVLGVATNIVESEENNRIKLSRQGLAGQEVRHRKTRELKLWVFSMAASMRDHHAGIARKLSAQIPDHLACVSKNPERFIYDALRTRRTPD